MSTVHLGVQGTIVLYLKRKVFNDTRPDQHTFSMHLTYFPELCSNKFTSSYQFYDL